MKLLFVSPAPIDRQALSLCGVASEEVAPSFMSAFTAMSIAKSADKHAASIVVASRMPDAMAAISARKLAKSNFKVVMVVAPNSDVPKGIPTDMRAGIDGWIFPSERLRTLFPSGLHAVSTITPLPADIALGELSPNPSGKYIWVGPLDDNSERLKCAVSAIDDAEGREALAVCGTGKAQQVMPAVKMSRNVNNRLGERIFWLGENFDLSQLAASAKGVVQSSPDPVPIELALVSKGLPMVDPSLAPVTIADGHAQQYADYFFSL